MSIERRGLAEGMETLTTNRHIPYFSFYKPEKSVKLPDYWSAYQKQSKYERINYSSFFRKKLSKPTNI